MLTLYLGLNCYFVEIYGFIFNKLIIMLTYVRLFLHTTDRGTDLRDNEFLEVALNIYQNISWQFL